MYFTNTWFKSTHSFIFSEINCHFLYDVARALWLSRKFCLLSVFSLAVDVARITAGYLDAQHFFPSIFLLKNGISF